MNHLFSEIKRYIPAEAFYQKVKERLKQIAGNNTKISLGTLDIDHFNYINDLLGFEIGDLILQKIAEHFSAILKDGEYFTRLHADIFAFCINITTYEEAVKQFQQLTDWGDLFQEILPSGYRLTTSGGIILAEDNLLPITTILDKANYARQKAKNNAFNAFRFYDDKMDAELKWQKSVTFSMESALENHEFEMYLQPKIHIKNELVAGAEALVRWNHPKHGLVPPDRFIPVMEQSGFIRKLDFFMLEEACLFLRECTKLNIPQLPISVNFSKVHLANENLVQQIFHTVANTGIAVGMIEIEFTESIFTEDFERLIEVFADLKLLGFRVSLDDFGSAYSSLNCLKELPVDIIKIDKGFLEASSNTEKGKLIITKVLEMIKLLHMFSIMEGVETAEQVEFLRKFHCDFAQGYFYAKPMPKNAYVDYLRNSSLSLDSQTWG